MQEDNQNLSPEIYSQRYKTQLLIIVIFAILLSGIVGIVIGVNIEKSAKTDRLARLQTSQASVTTIPSIPVKQSAPVISSSTLPQTTLAPLVSMTGWKTYTDPNYGYTFQYHPDWKSAWLPQKGDDTLPFGTGCTKTLINGQYVSSCENTSYGLSFTIPNSLSPKDSALRADVQLFNNDKNLPLYQWVQTHPTSYAAIQDHSIIQSITINGYQAIKVTIAPDAKIWGITIPPCDEAIYINGINNDKQNIIFVMQFGGNGEGSSKFYSNADPFVKKEMPIFDTFVNSFIFPK